MTIAALLATAAERWGERIFVVDDAGASWSFAAIEQRARQAAAGLRARGVSAGDRVALMAGNSVDFVAGWLGVVGLGAAVVPLSTLSAPPEVEARLALARCALVLDDAALAE
ncbi:MAG: AMP-binding protein, partial [Polyangia bacterium]